MTATHPYDAIVLGAGAAGMMAAAVAGQNGSRVLLADHADEPGKKILISGGGRCNFTNVHTAPDRFLSANPHFARSALARYTPGDFIALVDGYRIPWHEKTLGQLFCDGSARQIVTMLRNECAGGGVDWSLGEAVEAIDHADGQFRVKIGRQTAIAPKLVIATGGPSIPQMGATGFAYDVARQFGLKVVEPRPALVPLTLGGDETLFRELSGVSTEVVASAGKGRFREAALFTHRGLSGPAILQASSYWRHGEPVAIDFLPDRRDGWLTAEKRARPRATLRSAIGQALPARLAEALAEKIALDGNLADLPDKALAEAEARLASWPFHPNGTEGFMKAEVTIGGIATDALSQTTFEAKAVPGLHFIGEAVDVTGWLGGYNFQWAWASAVACGKAL
ncbi:MAG: aminoacetone oxidase family FAD-binding enzyme [Sphingomonas sp.]|uniref:NAD(P)/FAD-dependent oxidoreductase n=1 Tax=Sphingomonas sp. TaxID=28214 RepID=UPI00122B7A8A|nr:NAD(P)/FAD-dependent oxidoreductase [Sphingomonas sp.]THD35658.1 MAG: aminoacetone oxidase family FAD-binding enzyme [Sphingomonas sp.]